MEEIPFKLIFGLMVFRGLCYALSFKILTEIIVSQTLNYRSSEYVSVTQMVMPYSLFLRVWFRATFLFFFPTLRVEGTDFWLRPGWFWYSHYRGKVNARPVQLVVRVIDDFGIPEEYNDSYVMLTDEGIKVYPIKRAKE